MPAPRSARNASSSRSASASIANVTSPPTACASCSLAACEPRCGSTTSRSRRARSRTRSRTRLRGRARGPLAELDLDRAAVAVADQRQPDGVARAVVADLVGQVVLARELLVVHAHDQIPARGDPALALEGDLVGPGLDAGVLGRAAVHHVLHERAGL